MRCVAIINPNCLLSALPICEEFKRLEFATKGMAVLVVEATQEVYDFAYANRDVIYILTPNATPSDLPDWAKVLRCDLTTYPPVLKF